MPGNNVISLYDGSSILLTTTVYIDRNGVSLDEQPITPDHATASDHVDEAAGLWLTEQGCAP